MQRRTPNTTIIRIAQCIKTINLQGIFIWQRLNQKMVAFRWDKLYKTKVTSETTCDLVPPGVQSDVFNPGQNLTEGSVSFLPVFLLMPYNILFPEEKNLFSFQDIPRHI